MGEIRRFPSLIFIKVPASGNQVRSSNVHARSDVANRHRWSVSLASGLSPPHMNVTLGFARLLVNHGHWHGLPLDGSMKPLAA